MLQGTILDYLDWRGDLTLDHSPFNEIDALILSVLSYLPFDGAVPETFEKKGRSVADAARRILEKDPKSIAVRDPQDLELLAAVARTTRFGEMTLSGYVSKTDREEEKQFSAITIRTGDGPHFIAFRGTDLSIVGWKEDFNMSFMEAVPSQREAVAYLENAAKRLGGKFRTGGHSKGGNLAVYAASFCRKQTRKRITAVYSNDGPGFSAKTVAGEGFREIESRVFSFLPQSSFIGMLLEHSERYTVIYSDQRGLFQHDPYSWRVEGTAFARADSLTEKSVFIDHTVKDWISAMDVERRKLFIDALFEIIGATGATGVFELTGDWLRTAKAMGKTLKGLDAETKKALLETLALLFGAATKNMKERKGKRPSVTPSRALSFPSSGSRA